MFTAIASNIIIGWLWRRAQEIGGLAGTLFLFYQALPPDGQQAINQIFAGGWQNVSLGAVATIGVYVWSQVQSYRSTVKPQIVAANKQIGLPTLTLEEALAL